MRLRHSADDAFQIDARLRHAMRLADLGHRAVAFHLADLAFRGLHRQLGRPTAISYATHVLGTPKRKAQELLTAGRRLAALPRIDEAFAQALLPWSKVQRIVTVVLMILSSEPDGIVPGRKAVDGSIYKAIVTENEATEAAVSDGVTQHRMRESVFNQDGYLCRNCERPRQALNAHYVVLPRRGGPTETSNLVAHCRDGHSLVHAGYLKVDRAQCARHPAELTTGA